MCKEKPITNLIVSFRSYTSEVVRERVVMENYFVSLFILNLYVEVRVDEEVLNANNQILNYLFQKVEGNTCERLMLLTLKEELQATVMELTQCKVSGIDGIVTKFYKEN
jgi:hypothetical protein